MADTPAAAEQAWSAWYEPAPWSEALRTSPYDLAHRAFIAAYEIGRADEREAILREATRRKRTAQGRVKDFITLDDLADLIRARTTP